MRGCRHGRGERAAGQAAVEFSIAASVFFLVVFGLMQLAILHHARLQVIHATREGGRYAAVNGASATQEQIADYVIQQAPSLINPPLQRADVTVAPAAPPRDSGTNITVSVQYNAQATVPMIAPLLGGGAVFSESVTRRIE
ncbi:MAG: pilus assembly protein [Armatimonadetes bacterium]|nr:pilus assembly protein [Armatimonadota bacterium]